MPDEVVYTCDLKKWFPSRAGVVKAVDGLNLSVPAGEVFGFLGPNGAGKTTTLRILTTLIVADSGRAVVAGHDVREDPGAVRRSIGYVSQAGGSDRPATGRENLVLQGRLYGMPRAEAYNLAGLVGDARPGNAVCAPGAMRFSMPKGIFVNGISIP